MLVVLVSGWVFGVLGGGFGIRLVIRFWFVIVVLMLGGVKCNVVFGISSI